MKNENNKLIKECNNSQTLVENLTERKGKLEKERETVLLDANDAWGQVGRYEAGCR